MSTISFENKDLHFHYAFTHESNTQYALHCHPMYEIYYFIGGHTSYLVEGKEYHPTPHSLLLLPPNCFHGVHVDSNEEYGRFSLHFSSNIVPVENRHMLLSTFHQGEPELDIFYEHLERYDLFPFIQNILDSAHMPEDLLDVSLSIAIQALLARILFVSHCTKTSHPQERLSEPLSELIQYLNRNLTENISLDALSAKFYISKHHMNKLFRKATGTTIGEYIIYKRVTLAQNLIVEGASTAQAGLSAGFGDYSSFYRAYRRITGHSPRADKPEAEKKEPRLPQGPELYPNL